MPNAPTTNNLYSPNFTTPVMEAVYPYLVEPDTYGERPKWCVGLKIDRTKHAKMLEWLTQEENKLRAEAGLKPVTEFSKIRTKDPYEDYEGYEYITFQSTSPDHYKMVNAPTGELPWGAQIKVKGCIQYGNNKTKYIVLRPSEITVVSLPERSSGPSGEAVDFGDLPDSVDLGAQDVVLDLE